MVGSQPKKSEILMSIKEEDSSHSVAGEDEDGIKIDTVVLGKQNASVIESVDATTDMGRKREKTLAPYTKEESQDTMLLGFEARQESGRRPT